MEKGISLCFQTLYLLRSGIELHICQPIAVLHALFDFDFEAWYVDSLGPQVSDSGVLVWHGKMVSSVGRDRALSILCPAHLAEAHYGLFAWQVTKTRRRCGVV